MLRRENIGDLVDCVTELFVTRVCVCVWVCVCVTVLFVTMSFVAM